jgi:hypothetical protein
MLTLVHFIINVFSSSVGDDCPKFRKAAFITANSCSHRTNAILASAVFAAISSPFEEFDSVDESVPVAIFVLNFFTGTPIELC